jgi:hypothetical protein
LTITAWIEICLGTRFFFIGIDRWAIGIAFLVVCFANHYVLVMRGYGIRFEREFDTLDKSRKLLLRASCRVMELATVAFLICSVYVTGSFWTSTGSGLIGHGLRPNRSCGAWTACWNCCPERRSRPMRGSSALARCPTARRS